jgi:hypothetical protein
MHSHGQCHFEYLRQTCQSLYSPKRWKNNPTNKSAEYAAEAHKLLEQMKRKYNESGHKDWQPDVTSYTVVMAVYARCGAYQATQTAENLLHEVKQQYAATQDVRLRPNFRTYTIPDCGMGQDPVGRSTQPRRRIVGVNDQDSRDNKAQLPGLYVCHSMLGTESTFCQGATSLESIFK